MAFATIIRKIQEVKQFDIAQETCNIINENGKYVSDLLRTQLSKGIDSDDNPVTVFGRDYYADRTVFEKERYGTGLGKVTDRITNYFSGSFYSSIYVYASGSTFLFDSDVAHFAEIIAQSGTKIMELNKANLILLRDNIVIPGLQRKFNQIYGI